MTPFVWLIAAFVAAGAGFAILDRWHRRRAARRADAHARRIMQNLHGWTPPIVEEKPTDKWTGDNAN